MLEVFSVAQIREHCAHYANNSGGTFRAFLSVFERDGILYKVLNIPAVLGQYEFPFRIECYGIFHLIDFIIL